MKNKTHRNFYIAASVLVLALVFFGTIASAGTDSFLTQIFGTESMMDFEQEEQQARQFQQDIQNETRHINDRARECKDMQRQLKQPKKLFPQEAAEIEVQVSAFCANAAKAKKLLGQAVDMESLSDIRGEFNEWFSATPEIWDGLNSFNSRFNVVNELKNQKRTCKDWGRRVKEISRDAKRAKYDASTFLTEGNAKVAECNANLATLQNLANSGSWEEAQDLLDDYFHNNDTWQWFDEQRQIIQACSEVSRIVQQADREMKKGSQMIKRFADSGEDTSELDDLFVQGQELVRRAKEAQSSGGQCNVESTKEILEELDALGNQFEEAVSSLSFSGMDSFDRGGRGGRDDFGGGGNSGMRGDPRMMRGSPSGMGGGGEFGPMGEGHFGPPMMGPMGSGMGGNMGGGNFGPMGGNNFGPSDMGGFGPGVEPGGGMGGGNFGGPGGGF